MTDINSIDLYLFSIELLLGKHFSSINANPQTAGISPNKDKLGKGRGWEHRQGGYWDPLQNSAVTRVL